MEKLTFSILVCVYGNAQQFSNFLWTAYCQDHYSYEVVIVDNATPDASIKSTYDCCPRKIKNRLNYVFISQKDKRCRNITQGINLAASAAKGKYIVIVADPNVLLSFNLLESIEALIDDKSVVLSSGCNDVKISPGGFYDSEYARENPEKMAAQNEQLLKDMGWPCDPLNLRLIAGKHRFPQPHQHFDCYIVALSRKNYLKFGGYDESQRSWGEYHQVFVERLTKKLQRRNLTGVRIVHQYHRVYKDDPF